MSDPEPDGAPRHLRHRRWALNDDLLSGLDREGRPDGLRAFFATTIAGSLVVWDIAFALGAYHTVFYSRLFQILVVSVVLLAGSIVLRRSIAVRPWTRVILSVPLLWLVVHAAAPLGRDTHAQKVLDDTLVGLTVASLPFIMLAVVRVMAPDYFALPARRLKIATVLIVASVALGGFLVGEFNYKFTDCQQYVVAGDNTPSNCRMTPSASSSPSP